MDSGSGAMNSSPGSSQGNTSLVKRLAGPSTTKAGLPKDQTEINRIIAEASKGSKFYENEKRKDKDLTEKISRVLKQRKEVLKYADIPMIEHQVDQLLAELESNRDLSQIIVHVDMDAFFANVELLHNPELEGKPFGVGYGILTTASYEARKFGVRSAMPGFIAKKLCPDLIFVPINGARYSEKSRQVMDIFRRYDPNMCPSGTDEGYLNITSYCNEHNLSPDDCVQEMRAKVFEETKLTVSAGIAPNIMLAKICSDKNKPNGQFHLPFERDAITEFMRDLSVRKVPGIGRVNERILGSIGIKTCGDIYTHRAILSVMDKQLGSSFLLRTHLGISSNAVWPMQRHERKSVGAERTFDTLDDKEQILEKLEVVAAALEKDMQRSGWVGKTVTLKFKLDTYQAFTRAKSLNRWVMKKEDLFAIGKELLLPELPLRIRLIGLRVTRLKDLRAASPVGTIRQFFESASASKTGKVDNNGELLDPAFSETVDGGDDEFTGYDEFEDAMPGFHEEDEVDLDQAAADVEEFGEIDSELPEPRTDDSMDVGGPSRVRPPNSAPGRMSQKGKSTSNSDSALTASRTRIKPHSTGHAVRVSSSSLPSSQNSMQNDTVTETNTCPICGKTLKMDNQAFNAHVDFCLSRGAILEAQIQASSPVKRKPGTASNQDGPQRTHERDRKRKRQKG